MSTTYISIPDDLTNPKAYPNVHKGLCLWTYYQTPQRLLRTGERRNLREIRDLFVVAPSQLQVNAIEHACTLHTTFYNVLSSTFKGDSH